MRSSYAQALRRSRYHAVVIAMTGAKGLEAAIQAKRLAPEDTACLVER